jgi:MYXO-CTERM domain-containing protein
MSGAVEAAIDDVEITSNNPVCYTNPPPGDDETGCGCRIGAHSRPSFAPLAFLVAAAILYRRRSRR